MAVSVGPIHSSPNLGTIAGTVAWLVPLTLGGDGTVNAVVRLTMPSSPRATVVFIAGTNAVDFVSESSPGGLALLRSFAAAGYNVIELAFAKPNGWFWFGKSIRVRAERGAELLRYIRSMWGTGMFIVVGNSGGAGLGAYALAHYGAESFIDMLVSCSGPPMSRLDQACGTPSASEFRSAE